MSENARSHAKEREPGIERHHMPNHPACHVNGFLARKLLQQHIHRWRRTQARRLPVQEENDLDDQADESGGEAEPCRRLRHPRAEMPICHPRYVTPADQLAVLPQRTADVVWYIAIEKRKALF